MTKGAIICVGRLRPGPWREAATHYLDLLARWRAMAVVELRDGPLPPSRAMDQEGEQILGKIGPRDFPIALDSGGIGMTSPEFARLLRDCDENKLKRPAFIIGGPWGLAHAVLQSCPLHLSLSTMTWPHELARVLLLEQLYRAETIMRGTPYHH